MNSSIMQRVREVRANSIDDLACTINVPDRYSIMCYWNSVE
nr:hypothetical protein [Candidatus Sigynarchaeum springense]